MSTDWTLTIHGPTAALPAMAQLLRDQGYTVIGPKEPDPAVNAQREPKFMVRSMPVCVTCWNERKPNKRSGPLHDGPPESCVSCEKATRSGIYVRMRVEWP